MRKHYVDNIRWITVVIVVLYHVFYMYNAEGVVGVVGKISNLDVQYYDMFQYIVYPWFMFLLFMVSGMSSKFYLDKHTDKEFLASRTTKLLVPSTIGLFAFQFLQGYVNTLLSDVFTKSPEMPLVGKVIVILLSGIGVLWYIQLLWVFSLLLFFIKKIEKGHLLSLGKKAGPITLLLLCVPAFLTAQILNTPIIVVYRFGWYFFAFLMGYFVLSHEAVVEHLKKWFLLLLLMAVGLGTVFCVMYFGKNYADQPANRSLWFVEYGYFASLAIIGGMAKYGDICNGFTKWMSQRSFGLYVFHYLGISAMAWYVGRLKILPTPVTYLLTTLAGFVSGYVLYELISRIPFWRWAVLGMKKKRDKEK